MDEKEYITLEYIALKRIENTPSIPNNTRKELIKVIKNARATRDDKLIKYCIMQGDLISIKNEVAKLSEHITELEEELQAIKQRRMEELTYALQTANSERKLQEQIAELNSNFVKKP